MAESAPKFDAPQQFLGAVIFCPVCVTNVDSEGYGKQDFTCNNCGTEFTVNVDAEIVATHARFG